jgi:hypothetical protein
LLVIKCRTVYKVSHSISFILVLAGRGMASLMPGLAPL